MSVMLFLAKMKKVDQNDQKKFQVVNKQVQDPTGINTVGVNIVWLTYSCKN